MSTGQSALAGGAVVSPIVGSVGPSSTGQSALAGDAVVSPIVGSGGPSSTGQSVPAGGAVGSRIAGSFGDFMNLFMYCSVHGLKSADAKVKGSTPFHYLVVGANLLLYIANQEVKR